MNVQAFVRRHYSPDVGESPVGHVAAVLAGLACIALGAGLMIASIVFAPLGTVIGLLGMMLLAGGIFAHIQSPFKLSDALDAAVGLTGAAIAMTFSLIIAAMVLGLAVTAIFGVLQWLVD